MLEDNNKVTLQDDLKSDVLRREPVLSIIVPVYNAERYLKQCLDSILAQSFSDFEVLCIDDGSGDRSPQILDDYARLDSRVKAFHIQNQGVSHARNYALERATGIYVGFVDSDDWLDSDHFSILTKCFDDPDVDMAVGKVAYERTGADYDARSRVDSRKYTIKELTKNETFESLFFDLDVLGFCHNKLFKRENINDFFNEKVTFAEDMLFCCQYAYKIKKATGVDCQTYHYRYGSDSGALCMLKNLSRISGLDAELLIVELLSQDAELARYRSASTHSFLNFYFTLISRYSQAGNKDALAILKKYRPAAYKYLRLYWKSPYSGFLTKLGMSFKVCLPKLGVLLCRFSEFLRKRRLS